MWPSVSICRLSGRLTCGVWPPAFSFVAAAEFAAEFVVAGKIVAVCNPSFCISS